MHSKNNALDGNAQHVQQQTGLLIYLQEIVHNVEVVYETNELLSYFVMIAIMKLQLKHHFVLTKMSIQYKRIGYRIETCAIREWPFPSSPVTRHFLDAVEVDVDRKTVSTCNICSGTRDYCVEQMARAGGRLIDKTDIKKFLESLIK